MEEENKEQENKMSLKEFWIRLSCWVLFAVVVPVVFIICKFGLFVPSSPNDNSANSLKLSGWGILAIIIVAIFLLSLLKNVLKGLPKGSMFRQCIQGLKMLIPLLLLILLIDSMKDSMKQFEESMIALFVCEAIAIPINPFPKWAMQNNIDMAENVIVRSIKKASGKDNK